MSMLSLQARLDIGNLYLNGNVNANTINSTLGLSSTTGNSTYVGLHTAEPGALGANEATYTGYVRAGVGRNGLSGSSGEWIGTTSGSDVTFTNKNAINFNTAGSAQTCTHWSLWDSQTPGTGRLIAFGPIIVAGSAFFGGHVQDHTLNEIWVPLGATFSATTPIRVYHSYNARLRFPSGLVAGSRYFVRTTAGTTEDYRFTVETTLASGVDVDITTNGELMLVKSADLAVVNGGIPSIGAGQLACLALC